MTRADRVNAHAALGDAGEHLRPELRGEPGFIAVGEEGADLYSGGAGSEGGAQSIGRARAARQSTVGMSYALTPSMAIKLAFQRTANTVEDDTRSVIFQVATGF